MHKPKKELLLIYAVLISTTLIAFEPVRHNEFVDYDDQQYVTENTQVKSGITSEGLAWAFTKIHDGNWIPLTWLSHMLDCELFGVNSFWHHLTNLLLHIANTLLLFYVLHKMTGAVWRSGFVAALFALHPLHVESVAWVAERKDVLSTFFMMLTIAAYIRYARKPGVGRYLLVLFFFAPGLMAKPMLVTLPFVLLLLDYWPLGRFQITHSGFYRLVLEKVPLFILSAISSVITFMAQQHGGAVATIEKLPVMTRISNASVSYVSYAGKMFWPSRLAVFYPHPIDAIPLWQVITSALLLLIITVFVIHLARKHKYLLVGWLWYLVTLVPVIGLVQVGAQALADRYTYVPLTGLFIIISWGLGELCEKWGCRKIIIGVLAVIVLAVLSICTNLQVSYWRNDITLFEHALDVTKDNYMAHFCITQSFREQGRPDQALYHYSESVRIKPDHADAQIGLGCALLDAGRLEEALTCLQEGVKLAPNLGLAHYNLALALYKNGEIDNAIEHYKQTLQLEPDRTDACMSLGNLLAKRDRLDEAVSEYRKLLLIKPEETNVLNALGIVLGRQGKLDEAINHFTKALRIRPDFIEARNNLKYAQTLQDKSDKVK